MADLKNVNRPKKATVFRCKYCGSTFILGDELIAHKKNLHLAEIVAERKGKVQRTEPNQDKSKTRSIATAVSVNLERGLPHEFPAKTSLSVSEQESEDFSFSKVIQNTQPAFGYEHEDSNSDGEEEDKKRADSQSDIAPSSTEPMLNRLMPSSSCASSIVNNGFICPECNIEFSHDYQLHQHICRNERESCEKMEADSVLQKGECSDRETKPTVHESTPNEKVTDLESQTPDIAANKESSEIDVTELRPCHVVLARLPASALLPRSNSVRTSAFVTTTKRRGFIFNRRKGWKCYFCKKRFHRGGLLKAHLRTFHPGLVPPNQVKPPKPIFASVGIDASTPAYADKKPFTSIKAVSYRRFSVKRKCESYGCNYTTRDRQCMHRHSLLHTVQRKLKCPLCSASFINSGGRLSHLKSCHPGNDELFDTFRVSKRSVPRPGILMKIQTPSEDHHRDTDTSSENQDGGSADKILFPCTRCSSVFPSRMTLKHHSGKIHRVGDWIKCDYCPYESFYGCVKTHITRLHTNKYGDSYKCKYCGASCNSSGFLKRHIALLHKNLGKADTQGTAVMTFSQAQVERLKKSNEPKLLPRCDHCPYTSRYPFEVRGHMQRVHGEQRRYQCNECSASYDALLYFTKHVQSHKREAESGREASPGPKIVSVTSTSIQDGYQEEIPAVKSVRSTRTKAIMKEQDSDIDEEMEYADDTDLDVVEAMSKVQECRICGIPLEFSSSMGRHRRGDIHRYNENIYRRLNGLSELAGEQFIPSRRWGKIKCKVCQMIFNTHSRLAHHQESKHKRDVFLPAKPNRKKPKKAVATAAGNSKSRTAVVRSQPRIPEPQLSTTKATDIYYKGDETYPGEQSNDHDTSSWDFSRIASIPLAENPDFSKSISHETSKPLTVTRQNKGGLKITTVRLGQSSQSQSANDGL